MHITANSDKVLLNKLRQAEHHWENNRDKQAIKQLEGFLKHLNRSKLSDEIRAQLAEMAQTVITAWSSK